MYKFIASNAPVIKAPTRLSPLSDVKMRGGPKEGSDDGQRGEGGGDRQFDTREK